MGTAIADTIKPPEPDPGDLGDGLHATVNRRLTILSQFSARLREILAEAGLSPEIGNAILPGGFVIPDSWTVITDMEIFGDIAEVAQPTTRRYHKHALRRTDDLKPGDYVVHIDYGIGRFAQLTQREISGTEKSFVEVEYATRPALRAGGQLDRLRRYRLTAPQLNHRPTPGRRRRRSARHAGTGQETAQSLPFAHVAPWLRLWAVHNLAGRVRGWLPLQAD
jgi:hypothetical protein